MRILHLSSARAFGGGERHFVDLTLSLAARDHEVYAALVPSTPLFENLARLLPASRLLTLPLRNALDVQSARGLTEFVKQNRIEIVHAHVARDYPLAAYAARRTHGASLVITRHVPFPLSKLHRLILSDVARVIAVSEPVAAQLDARRIVSPDKIRVIPNGIDLARFDLSATNFNRDHYRRELPATATLLVGTVGELSEVKGQTDFVTAVAHIARQGHDDVAFLIAGEDHSPRRETRARLEHLLTEHKLLARVLLLGEVSEVAPLLASLDVFVSSSRVEAFGLAMVEAMACGVPVVATATDGARSIVEEKVSGKLVHIGDARALASAVIEFLENAESRARFGAAGRERVRRFFSLERMVRATEEVYREAMFAA